MVRTKGFSTLVALGGLALSAVSGCSDQSDPAASEGDMDIATIDCLPKSVNPDPYFVADARGENRPDHEDASDYTWNSSEAVPIELMGDEIDVGGSGASADGSVLTITSSGTYNIQGTLDDGQIVVDAEDTGLVRLVLNGMAVSNSGNAAFVVLGADKTVLILADGTTNQVTDGATYPEGIDPNAALFSKDPLSIGGNGSLTVVGRYNDGITSKDGLVIHSGHLTVTAEDDGIRGKDYLVVRGGTLEVTSGGDGLKSDNDSDETLGFILVEDGTLDIDAGGDGLSAETDALVTGGDLTIRSGGGSSHSISQDLSAKALKGGSEVVLDAGTFSIDAADDGLHSNGILVINGGVYTIASGDDAVHADAELVIDDGEITVTKSYEAIENTEADMTINGGTIRVVASDDGINVAGAGDMGPGGPQAGAGKYYLRINGGYIVSDARGDGLDINGSIVMNQGCLLVHGPTSNANGAIDYDGSFQMNGGFLAAAGSAGMAQAPGSSSSQYSVLVVFSSPISAGTLIHFHDGNGEDLLDFVPSRAYQALAFSSPNLTKNHTYKLFLGGEATGTLTDGLYRGGTYTPGSQVGSFTVNGILSLVGF